MTEVINSISIIFLAISVTITAVGVWILRKTVAEQQKRLDEHQAAITTGRHIPPAVIFHGD